MLFLFTPTVPIDKQHGPPWRRDRLKMDLAFLRLRHRRRLRCPEILIRSVENLDVVEHLDPVGRVPTGYDKPQREAVQWRELLTVHGIGDHDFAVARGR